MDRQLKAVVRGRVQGVGFRAWVAQEAMKLGLRGTVRNSPDGSVEVVSVGPEERLQALIALLWRGPALAAVSDVSSAWSKVAVEPVGFRVIQ